MSVLHVITQQVELCEMSMDQTDLVFYQHACGFKNIKLIVRASSCHVIEEQRTKILY